MSNIEELNRILQQLDTESFLNHIGMQKNRKGKWYVDCPFCEGKEKLSINVQKGLWSCFKCSEKGNLITLYAKLHNCSNGDAVKAIKEFMGIIDEPKRKGSYKPKNVKPLKVKDIQTNPNQKGGDDIPSPADADTPPETKHVDSVRAAQPRDIYTALVKLARLTDAHRNELRTKRGFTNDTIERLSFRSGGEYISDIVETLRETFTDPDLKDAGIIVEINGCLVCNPQLIEDRVLIPYMDTSGAVY
ncbi:MAG: CHC2 zinc finger domain-containing protein, partial [Bacillota bacterium]